MKFFPALCLALTVALSPLALPAADAAGPAAAKAPDFSAAKKYVQVVVWTKADGRRYTLGDAEMVVELADPNAADGADPFATGKRQSLKLDAAAVTETWDKIEKLNIPKWRGIYDAADSGQEDAGGTEWSVELRLGAVKKQSRGANAFPALNPLGMIQLGNGAAGGDAASALSELVEALKAQAARSGA